MSGDYVLHCSCGASETMSAGNTRLSADTIESAIKLMPALESLNEEGWEVSELRGTTCDYAGQLVWFLLEHWRHGELSYSYNNNSNPPIVLKIPPEVGLPEPCGTCKGRLLVPCPACVEVKKPS